MKSLIKIMAACFLIGTFSCNKFLDVVPNDTATLDHAFSNRSVMDKFMRTCYSGLPDPTDPFYYPAYFTSTDEFDWRTESRAGNSLAGMISKGFQNSNTPYQDYWSGKAISGKGSVGSLYIAIRDCNIFLENAHIPRDIDEYERKRWIAEVKFLKAYYHFFLMELYGPIVLVKENLPVSATPAESRAYREPVDECVDYIVSLLDEAMPDLPLVLPDPASEQGRITQCIALSVKAKVLTLAASPVFNGNTDYAGWVDNRGKQLVSQTYDLKKWERAATAIKEAIDACHSAGYRLYHFNKYAGGQQTFAMNDTLVQEMTIRKAITEDLDKNTGVIWATQEQFADGKGYAAGLGYSILGNMPRMLFQFLYPTDLSPSYVNYLSASWHVGELFYSNNGVPIDEDKYFDYANRYQPRRATPSDNHQSYIATGEVTASMHFNREPRFYADLGFDRGYWELSSTTNDGGKTFGPFIKSRPGEIGTATGQGSYTPKKIESFESSASKGMDGQPWTPHDYRFPLIRLSDLYLLYSEALNEVKPAPDGEVYYWIDSVRAVAGLKSVVESWQNASRYPDAPRNKNEMRDIIRKERLIELVFEGQRFWDIRRWKIAKDYWSLPRMSWGKAKTDNEFYTPLVYGAARQVSFRDYLYPISAADLRVNPNLVQTYGW
jgi:hypothetical protein